MNEDFKTTVGPFQIIPNFNAQSRNGSVCSLSGLPMQEPELGRPDDQVDAFVLRGPMIDFEGYFDVRPSVIIAMAKELGMVSEDDYHQAVTERSMAEERLNNSQASNAAYQHEVDNLRATLRELLNVAGGSEDVLDQEDTVRLDDIDG